MAQPKNNTVIDKYLKENFHLLLKRRKIDGTRPYWEDSEDYTGQEEPFKVIDAINSLTIISMRFDTQFGNIFNTKKELQIFKDLIKHDFKYLDDQISKNGFFPLPYLWSVGKPFDSMDFASHTCMMCVKILGKNLLWTDSDIKKIVEKFLEKSVATIISGASKKGKTFTWSGSSINQKQQASKFYPGIKSTYFTALCCSALSKYYLFALENSQYQFNNELQNIRVIVQSAIKWVFSRYNNDEDRFYKSQKDNEHAVFWPSVALVAFCDANPLMEKEESLQQKANLLWKSYIKILQGKTSKAGRHSLVNETTTMLINTPEQPGYYEDRISDGYLLYALLKYYDTYAMMEDKTAVSFISTTIAENINKFIQGDFKLIMENQYNLLAYIRYNRFIKPMSVKVPLEVIKKEFELIIDKKNDEIKTEMLTILKKYEKEESESK